MISISFDNVDSSYRENKSKLERLKKIQQIVDKHQDEDLIPHKDIDGNELRIGDRVRFIWYGGTGFEIGTIAGYTKKMIRVTYKSFRGTDMTLKGPSQVIKTIKGND